MLAIVYFLRDIYFDTNINNLPGQLVVVTSNQIRTFIFHSYYIFFFSIFDSNKYSGYVFWSPTKTINFFRF